MRFARAFALGFLAAALAACQTLPAVMREEDGRFSIRFAPETAPIADIDARAAAQCGAPAQFISQEDRFDGFTYRTYRCAGAGS